MKKYFIKETGNEVKMGERIQVCATKDEDGSTTQVMVNSILCEETVEYLLELDVIEEKDFPDENCPEEDDFEDCEFVEVIDHLLEVTEEVEKKIKRLEKSVEALKKTVKSIIDSNY